MDILCPFGRKGINVENLNYITEFPNDFDSYYDEDSNKSFFTANASVKNYANEAI